MAKQDLQIGLEQLGIGGVLRQYSLIVPPNQREYSWTEREVSDLFHDLNRAISEEASEYFLGSIVTIPKKLGTLEVVDGQQRLATTAILLAAIRNYLQNKEREKLIVEDIENNFLTVIDRDARDRVSRLRLNVADAGFFDERVLRNNQNAAKSAISHTLIGEAAELARQYVSGLVRAHDEKHHGDVLNRWVGFILHRAIVILLKVPSDANAYKMFETLNDRGLRTSQSDLVKNYLFGESGERLPEAQQKWTSIKSLLESLDDDDITINFLRQMLISLYGYLRQPDVYEIVQRHARGAASTLQFLTKLESGATDYVAMLNPEHQKWNRYPTSTRRAIQTLILLGMKPMRPVILSISRAFDPPEADKALRMLVNLSVRFLIVGGARSGSVEQALATAARDISEGKITTARQLLDSLGKIAPKDPELKAQFTVATVSQASLARYYLRALELTVKGDPFPCFVPNENEDVINLEHVLPKNPEGNWPQFTADQADALYRRLGNMALLQAKQNADLRSAAFAEKKLVFAASPYELTNQISRANDWTPDAIDDRQKVMADLALKTWPLDVR